MILEKHGVHLSSERETQEFLQTLLNTLGVTEVFIFDEGSRFGEHLGKKSAAHGGHSFTYAKSPEQIKKYPSHIIVTSLKEIIKKAVEHNTDLIGEILPKASNLVSLQIKSPLMSFIKGTFILNITQLQGLI